MLLIGPQSLLRLQLFLFCDCSFVAVRHRNRIGPSKFIFFLTSSCFMGKNKTPNNALIQGRFVLFRGRELAFSYILKCFFKCFNFRLLIFYFLVFRCLICKILFNTRFSFCYSFLCFSNILMKVFILLSQFF